VFEYAITCTCDFAVLQRRRVLLTPDSKVRGQFSLLVEVRTPAGDLVNRRSLEVSVVDPQAGSGQSFQMLMVGDSLGHANHFPDELTNLLRRPGNPDVTCVGSFDLRARRFRTSNTAAARSGILTSCSMRTREIAKRTAARSFFRV